MKQITAVIPILIACALAQSLPPISPGFCAINRSNGYDIVPCDVSTIPGPPHRDVVPPDTKSAEKLAGEAVQQANKPQPAPQFGLRPLFPTTPPATSPQFALDYVPAPTQQAPVDDGEYYRYLQQRNAQNAQFGEQIGAALGTGLRALVVHNKSQSPPSIPSPRQARDSFAAQFNGTLDVRAQVIGSTLVLHNPMACSQMYSRYAKNTSLLQGLRQIGFSTLTATDDRGYEFTIDLMSPPSVASIAPSGTLVAPTIRDIASTLLSRFSTLPPGTHITLAQGSDSYADLLRREVHAKELAESMPEDWIELNAFYTNRADYERRISIATDEEKCHSLETNTALHEKLAQQGFFTLSVSTMEHDCFEFDLLTRKLVK
jgi:hypothetical protein